MPTIDGLTKEQRQELDLHTATDKMFGTFSTQVDAYNPLKKLVALHKTHIKDVNDLLPEKMRNTVIITENKNESRLALEVKYRPICAITLFYANNTENRSLAAAMKIGSRQLLIAPDLDLQVIISNINDAIEPIIDNVDYVQYGITALMLSSGLSDSKLFLASLGLGRQVVESVIVATLALERLFVPLRKDKSDIELIMQYFNPIGGIKPDETFYNSIVSTMVVNKLAHVHTILEGHIYEEGVEKLVIKDVMVKNLTTGKMAISDLLGYYIISKFKGGVFEFEISAVGYQTIIVVVTIVMGKHIVMDFTLKRI